MTLNYVGTCLAFSAAPTSSSCVVISCKQVADVVIDTWRPGESAWTTHRFKKCEPSWLWGPGEPAGATHFKNCEPSCHRYWTKCVFSNGVFYCLSTCGHLGVFDPREATWNLLPVKQCRAFLPDYFCFVTPVHLTEHEGDIFAIYTHQDNSNPTVFKLNMEQNVWDEKRDLGGLTVFTSASASFIRSGLSPEVRNRVYPSLADTNGKYYSLGDGRSSNPPPSPSLARCVAWV
ncbi:unnamed protein product [Thlaspi arvense]|uniref:KIB1-4 beta-propeller domain-containing protein n=1 Tax=Thlaspi arvense TaxID=13288 RepID=A0AAU9RU67_THLAR|nr:unnamed protein product [Thlaspi arvense]